MARRPESVLVLVATHGGQVLLLERVHPPGFWQSVTGSLRRGESAMAAAARELEEETGVAAASRIEDLHASERFAIRPEWRHRFAPGVTENLEHWFRLWLAGPVDVKLNPREHRACEWVEAQAACKRVASWTNRAALERFVIPVLASNTPGRSGD